MPTRQNPVTRFGSGGFHGFTSKPRITHFGPWEGNRNAPPKSLQYRLWRDGYYDSQGNPHREGDLALTPDLARKYRYGQIVTEGGVTGRFTDVTAGRLSNRVDVWHAENPAGGGNNGSLAPSRPRQLASDEWQTSEGDRRFLPQPEPQPETMVADNRPAVPGRSPSLITDTNDDWIGAEKPPPILFANSDAGYEAVSPGLSGETLRSLPNARFEFPSETGALVEAGANDMIPDEWWKQPANGVDMTAADAGDIWGESSLFGAADVATGQSWGGFAPYSEQDSHVFEVNPETNRRELLADNDLNSLPPPSTEPHDIALNLEEPNPLDELLRQEPPDANSQFDFGNEPVPTSHLFAGMDTTGRPMPNLASFGLSPLSGFQVGAFAFGDSVESGRIDFGGRPPGLQPGEGYPERGWALSEAERQGEIDTARARAAGEIPLDAGVAPGEEGSIAQGRAVSPEVRRALPVDSYFNYGTGTYEPLHEPLTARTQGGGYNYGYGQSLSSQENAKLMNFAAFGGTPNRPLPDEPSSLHGANMRTMDPFTGELTKPLPGGRYRVGTNSWSRLLTTAAGRSAASRLNTQQRTALAGHADNFGSTGGFGGMAGFSLARQAARSKINGRTWKMPTLSVAGREG